MKEMRFIMFVCLFLVFFSCQRETGYEIRGYFEGAPEGTIIYLGEDSTQIVNGKFVFKGKVEAPVLLSLRVSAINEYGFPDYKGTRLWVNNEPIQVECPWRKLTRVYSYSDQMQISGSKLNHLFRNYQRQYSILGHPRDSLWSIYQKVYLMPSFEGGKVDVEAGMKVMREIRKIATQRRQLACDYITSYPSSPLAVEILAGQLYGQNYTVEEAQGMIDRLDTTLKNIPAYQELIAAFQDFRSTAKGEKYTDVALTDESGKEVKLSEVIQPGKYNMLEFWASWCSPCRGEIPHLRHVNEACGEDFNIISISIDEKEKDWKKAVEEEKMNWKQLRDAKGWKGGASQAYRIEGVPYSLILDGEGKIVAGDLRGAELDIVLIELLGEKAAKL